MIKKLKSKLCFLHKERKGKGGESVIYCALQEELCLSLYIRDNLVPNVSITKGAICY